MSETAPGYAERTVPEFHPIADRKLNSLLADGWQINGYAIMKGEDRRGFVDFGGFVGWWLPEYYASHTSDATFEAAEAEVARLKDAEAALVIRVEKLLLAKLGREWTPAGISIVSLIDELAARSLRPAGQGEALKTYLAENAKHGWTGRALSFDGGGLHLDRDGNAEFIFNMDDLEPYYEEGKSLMLAKVPAAEIEALRDYFVAAYLATPRPEASDAPDIVEPPMRIRVAQDGEGFWTCREAISGSPEYVRADALAALRAELAAAERVIGRLNGGEELQALMVRNNDLLSRAEAAEDEVARLKDEKPVCDVLTIKHSSGFPDHFARVTVGDRSLTFYMSKIKGQCEYHAAEFNWLLCGGEKPNIMAFDYTEPEGLAAYRSLTAAKGG